MKPLTAYEVEEFYTQIAREKAPQFYSHYLEARDFSCGKVRRRLYNGRIRYEWDDSGQSWRIEEVKNYKYGEVVTKLYQNQYGIWWRLWDGEPTTQEMEAERWESPISSWT